MSLRSVFTQLLCLCFFVSCSSTPHAAYRRRLQVRQFANIDFARLLHVIKKVIQDEGYQMKDEDFVQGTLSASLRKTDEGTSFWSLLGGYRKATPGEFFEFSANLYRLKNNALQCRVSLQRRVHHSLGVDEGEEILQPQFYEDFYAKLTRGLGSEFKQTSPGVSAQTFNGAAKAPTVEAPANPPAAPAVPNPAGEPAPARVVAPAVGSPPTPIPTPAREGASAAPTIPRSTIKK